MLLLSLHALTAASIVSCQILASPVSKAAPTVPPLADRDITDLKKAVHQLKSQPGRTPKQISLKSEAEQYLFDLENTRIRSLYTSKSRYVPKKKKEEYKKLYSGQEHHLYDVVKGKLIEIQGQKLVNENGRNKPRGRANKGVA